MISDNVALRSLLEGLHRMYAEQNRHPSNHPVHPLTEELQDEELAEELADTLTLDEDLRSTPETEGKKDPAEIDPEARAKTLGFDPETAPERPFGTPVVVDFDSEHAAAMAKLPQSMADETHAERVRTGLRPDPAQVPTGEDIERYTEKRDAVSEWRNKYLQARSLITALAYPLEQFIVLLGGSVPWGTEPQDLIGPSSSALEALRVLKANWDSMQPELAARAAAEASQEVSAVDDGGLEPGATE